jgi:hypothetical protein
LGVILRVRVIAHPAISKIRAGKTFVLHRKIRTLLPDADLNREVVRMRSRAQRIRARNAQSPVQMWQYMDQRRMRLRVWHSRHPPLNSGGLQHRDSLKCTTAYASEALNTVDCWPSQMSAASPWWCSCANELKRRRPRTALTALPQRAASRATARGRERQKPPRTLARESAVRHARASRCASFLSEQHVM